MATYNTMKRGRKGVNICMRPLCKCGQRPRAVNYNKNGRTYYRSLCEICMAHGVNHGIPRWFRAGYRIKSQCDRCGFKSLHKDPFRVFHIDGDLNNCRPANLKTVCLNCASVLTKDGVLWKQGDLVADY